MAEWYSTLRTGVEPIDRVHQELITRLDELGAAMKRGRGKRMMGEFRDFIERHTRRHFELEEALMHNEVFPGAEEHRAAHGRFWVGLARWEHGSVQNGPGDHPAELLQLHGYVMHWLATHEIPEDGMFSDYLRERRTRASADGGTECPWPALRLQDLERK